MGRNTHDEKGDGKFHLVRHAAIRSEKHPPFEAGKIELIDPKGYITFSVPYSAGGKGHGAPKFKDMNLEPHSAPADLKGINGPLTVKEAIRLTNTHYLIHKDFNTAKGLGCFHVSENDMHKLCTLWDRIPEKKKSSVFHAVKDHDPNTYKQTVTMLKTKGIHWEEHSEERMAKAKESAKRVVTRQTHHTNHELSPTELVRNTSHDTKIR